MAELRTTVHVFDDDGKPHIFSPGSVVPGWATKKITNPAAWEPEAEPAEPEPSEPAGEPSESWTVPQLRAYAQDKGIDLGEATKKADILAAITAVPGQ